MILPQGMAALLPLLDASLQDLETLSQIQTDALVRALVVRRRRAVAALHRQTGLPVLRRAQGQIAGGQTAPAIGCDPAPDLAAMIAAEWRLAHRIGTLLRQPDAVPQGDAAFLLRLVAEIEETALSLRLMDRRGP